MRNVFRRLPGFMRTPAGMERSILRVLTLAIGAYIVMVMKGPSPMPAPSTTSTALTRKRGRGGAENVEHRFASQPQTLAMRRFLLALILSTLPPLALAIEEPSYEVVQQLDGAEVRQYAPYVVAQVLVAGTAEQAGSEAFPILAGYIFGKNKGERKFAMTAPVTQTAAPVKMEMTAPVTQASVAGGMRVQFVLPKGVTVESAPQPLDPRVQVRLVPASAWAAIRYSGMWTQSNYDEHLALLRATLDKAGVVTQGEPVLARYNAPFTPWFLRRNEIWLALR